MRMASLRVYCVLNANDSGAVKCNDDEARRTLPRRDVTSPIAVGPSMDVDLDGLTIPLLDALLDIATLIHGPLDVSQCMLQVCCVGCCGMLDLAAVQLGSIREVRTF